MIPRRFLTVFCQPDMRLQTPMKYKVSENTFLGVSKHSIHIKTEPLRNCFLLCWTDLNWFMGRLSRATCNVVSVQTSKEGIECTKLMKFQILPKNTLKILFVWKNLGLHNLLSRFTDLYRLSKALLSTVEVGEKSYLKRSIYDQW